MRKIDESFLETLYNDPLFLQHLRNFDQSFHFGRKESLTVWAASPKILVAVDVESPSVEFFFEIGELPDHRGYSDNHEPRLFEREVFGVEE